MSKMTRKITISGNWRKGGPENEWAGSGTVDQYRAIECSAELGEEAYDLIEEQIADGDTDGSVTVHDAEQDRDVTYRWEIDTTVCPACGGDPMLCECKTPWSED